MMRARNLFRHGRGGDTRPPGGVRRGGRGIESPLTPEPRDERLVPVMGIPASLSPQSNPHPSEEEIHRVATERSGVEKPGVGGPAGPQGRGRQSGLTFLRKQLTMRRYGKRISREVSGLEAGKSKVQGSSGPILLVFRTTLHLPIGAGRGCLQRTGATSLPGNFNLAMERELGGSSGGFLLELTGKARTGNRRRAQSAPLLGRVGNRRLAGQGSAELRSSC